MNSSNIQESWALITVATTAAAQLTFGDVSIPYVGVALPVLAASFAGALFGVAYGEEIKPRSRMYKTILGNAFIGMTLVSFLPFVPFLSFIQKVPQAPLGGLLAFFCRWLIPALIVKLPEYIKGLGDKK